MYNILLLLSNKNYITLHTLNTLLSYQTVNQLTSLPLCEQVPSVWSLRREPPSIQVHWTCHGRMSCAVTHLQPTSLWRETTHRHRRQTALNQTSHTILAATSGARQPILMLMSPLAVRVYSTLVSKMFLNKLLMYVFFFVVCIVKHTHLALAMFSSG